MYEDVKMPGYITSLLAILGSFIGGYLLKTGLVTGEQLQQLGAAALAVVVIVWRMYAKRVNRQALKDAIAAPAGLAKPPV